jgi:hypothetical protein
MELLFSIVISVPVFFMIGAFVILPIYHGLRVLMGGALMVAEEAGFIVIPTKTDMTETKRARRGAGW